jgi:hypothetical protein
MTTEIVRIYKSISTVPTPYIPNAVYYVRIGTGIDIYVANSTGDAIFKHNTSTSNYTDYVISVDYPAVKIKEITIKDSNCTTNSIISIYWNEDTENSSELDQFNFHIIPNNGNFNIIMQHCNADSFGGQFNIKYKIE